MQRILSLLVVVFGAKAERTKNVPVSMEEFVLKLHLWDRMGGRG